MTEAVYTGPGATKTFKYTYDADGDLEKLVSPFGTTNYKYDSMNRLTEEAFPYGSRVYYAYDEASNLKSFTEGAGTTEYLYNKVNRLDTMAEPGGNCGEKPSLCTTFSYDGAGSLEKITYPSKATLNYTRNATTGSPTAMTAKSPSGTTLLSNTYSYVDSGDNTPLIRKDEYTQGSIANTTKYEYDPLDRLLEATTTGTNPSHYFYELDGAGNRLFQKASTTSSSGGTETFYDYNSGNELECSMKSKAACSKSSSSEISGYSYDGAGNETEITGYAEPASTSFSYNNLNQLKDLTPPSTGEQEINYLTGGQRSLIGVGSIELQNTTPGLTAQTNASGQSYYERTPTGLIIDEHLPGSKDYNPIYDAQGDVIALLSSSGELAQTVRYGPYGENATASGSLSYSTTNDPFLFQSGYHLAGGDPGPGNVPNDLYHYGERYYDPTTGRWTQQDARDQIGSSTQADRYGAFAEDPINLADPTGEAGVPRAALCTQSDGKFKREHPSYCEGAESDELVAIFVYGLEKFGTYTDAKECFVETGECEHISEDLAALL